jgi:transcriptional regulator GlxA family with amidase domain
MSSSLQRYGFLLLPGFGLQALTGALEVLAAANALLEGECVYSAEMLGLESSVSSAAGATLQCAPLSRLDAEPPLDALFVLSEDDAFLDPHTHAPGLLAWLRACAAKGMVLGGMGTGAAWLAEAGVLQGHRATLDWPQLAVLQERGLGAAHGALLTQHRYEIDRQRLSCAGQQASTDLFIAWLAQRHGERLAPELQALLGLERLRAADERQRQPLAQRVQGGSAKLAEAVALMEANLAEPLSSEDIASLVGVSRRQLERLFKQHLDALPARWYLALRLDHARRMLRQTHQSVLQIGLSCGFASASHFSSAYRTRYGMTPRDERSRHALARRAGVARMETPDHES